MSEDKFKLGKERAIGTVTVDLLTPQEREFVERLRNEYLGLYQGITLLTIIDRIAPKPQEKK